jgi:hypothetical protein
MLPVDRHEAGDGDVQVGRLSEPFADQVNDRLEDGLTRCPDVAFAYLAEVRITGRHEAPEPALLVWLRPAAMSSVRAALNLVSEVVSGVLPSARYLDVVILNSAPELLDPLEAADCLVVEPDPEERRRALASAGREDPPSPLPAGPWWWPF